MALREEVIKTVDQVIKEHVEYILRTHRGAPNSYIAKTLGWSRTKFLKYAADNNFKLTSVYGNKGSALRNRYEQRKQAFADAAAELSAGAVLDK